MKAKKEKIAIWTLVASLIVISIGLSGCTGTDENTIVIGTSADFAPFEYIDENTGNIVGFDIDMVKSILQDAGYKVEVKDISFDSLIPSVQGGKIDVIAAAMTITESRAEQIDFTDPYYEADQSILVESDTELNLNSAQDLQNFTVGAQTGTTGAQWVQTTLIDNGTMNTNDFKKYETYTLAVLDLSNGNIDAVVLDKPVAQAYESNKNVNIEMTIITGESYGLGVKKGNSDLLQTLNEGLDTLIGSEEWIALVQKYFE
ncbi:MAG: basic amino acid ABC transporter substrate-binding protein [Thermoplasmatota archaeon]